MRGAARVTILNARIFTCTAPVDSCPSSAVQLLTAWLIAMAFCAGMKRDTRTIKTISSADGFTGSAPSESGSLAPVVRVISWFVNALLRNQTMKYTKEHPLVRELCVRL